MEELENRAEELAGRAEELGGQVQDLQQNLELLTKQIEAAGGAAPAATPAATAGTEAAVADMAQKAGEMVASGGGGVDPIVIGLTVFVLACFVGYYVVWRVTPALHSPLMAVTNAVSSVIIVGALIAAGPAGFDFSKLMGFLAVILASVNIFGGFIVTKRMLSMFKKKQ